MAVTIIIGNVGSGKSTLLAKLAKSALKKKKNVYSNFYLEGTQILHIRDDFNYNLIENGLVIIDEGAAEFDARAWKSFGDRMSRFFQMHRHYNCDIVIATQRFEDVDVRIRNLCKTIIVVRKSTFPFCISRRYISTRIDIDETETQIIQKYSYRSFFIGGYRLSIAPLHWKMFNSFYRDKLNIRDWYNWNTENQDLFTKDYTVPDYPKK